MSSAAAGSETGPPGPSPGTADELPMQQQQPLPPPQEEEVVVAAAEAQAPVPVPVAVAAAEVPAPVSVLTIVISRPEEVTPESKAIAQASPGPLEIGDDSAMAALAAAKEAELTRSDSFDEQCRVCQQKSEEPLVELGCRCRGDLSKAHRTCIDVWFRTRGSNKCEICQQVAVNIPPPETQASGWFSPLWVAFAILIGGLLLDVLISVSLGVSTLPVNIIIGVLIILGLGTAFRLALECCQEFGSRRSMPRMENMAPSGYHPGV